VGVRLNNPAVATPNLDQLENSITAHYANHEFLLTGLPALVAQRFKLLDGNFERAIGQPTTQLSQSSESLESSCSQFRAPARSVKELSNRYVQLCRDRLQGVEAWKTLGTLNVRNGIDGPTNQVR
jgi:hypothetical protein